MLFYSCTSIVDGIETDRGKIVGLKSWKSSGRFKSVLSKQSHSKIVGSIIVASRYRMLFFANASIDRHFIIFQFQPTTRQDNGQADETNTITDSQDHNNNVEAVRQENKTTDHGQETATCYANNGQEKTTATCSKMAKTIMAKKKQQTTKKTRGKSKGRPKREHNWH